MYDVIPDMEVHGLISVLKAEFKGNLAWAYGFARVILWAKFMFTVTNFLVHRFFVSKLFMAWSTVLLLTIKDHASELTVAEGVSSWVVDHKYVKKRVYSFNSLVGYCIL